MTYIRLYSDKQLVSALKVLSPFNWSLWTKYRDISQIPLPDPSQGEILDAPNCLPEKDLAQSRV